VGLTRIEHTAEVWRQPVAAIAAGACDAAAAARNLSPRCVRTTNSSLPRDATSTPKPAPKNEAPTCCGTIVPQPVAKAFESKLARRRRLPGRRFPPLLRSKSFLKGPGGAPAAGHRDARRERPLGSEPSRDRCQAVARLADLRASAWSRPFAVCLRRGSQHGADRRYVRDHDGDGPPALPSDEKPLAPGRL